MPTFRSIAINLVSQFDGLALPEFAPITATAAAPSGRSPISSDGDDDDENQDMSLIDSSKSLVSVYVPRNSRSLLWISYSVFSPDSCRILFYFKLFLNDVHVVSWGVATKTAAAGKIMFSLTGPNNRNNDDDDTNDNGSRRALEKKMLCFGDDTGQAAVDDLLEIRVYRSRGRRRCEISELDTRRLPKEAGPGSEQTQGIRSVSD